MSNSVPEGWNIYSLDELGQVVGGGTPESNNTDYWGGDIYWATPKEITKLSSRYINKTERTITQDGLDRSSAKLHPIGTILLTSRASVGYPAINTIPMATNQGFQSLRPNNKLDTEYGYQCLLNSRNKLEKLSAGSTFLEISSKEVKKFKVVIPPLPEQKKIAAILTSVDTVIEKTQAQIDKLKDLKTGMMQELLTKGIGHTEFKDSPVGRIPVEWGVVTVLELGNGHKDTVQTGPFGAQLHSKDYVEEGIPLVLIKNIKEDGLDDTDIPKITEKDANRLSRYRLKEGDIVFSRVGRVGSCFLCSKNEEGWVFSGQTLRIRFNNSKVDLTYFNYALRTEEIQKELIGESVGSTRSSINTTILESLSVKLPPIQEQKKIASILQSLDSNIKSRELKLKQLMSVKKALMQDLLTGKVRVKV